MDHAIELILVLVAILLELSNCTHNLNESFYNAVKLYLLVFDMAEQRIVEKFLHEFRLLNILLLSVLDLSDNFRMRVFRFVQVAKKHLDAFGNRLNLERLHLA